MTHDDLDRTLAILKDFQRDTVEHVYQRMYNDPEPSTRFLVADEVGLGKTMIARGVIAKAIHRALSRDPNRRFDVVYICSNSAIARQNINSLNVTGTKNFPLPDRITLLPRDIRNLQRNRVNFISFTPGTSFNVRAGGGKSEERELLYWLLPQPWIEANTHGAISVLMEAVRRDRFQWRVENFARWYEVDSKLREDFRAALALADDKTTDPQQTLAARFIRLADQVGRRSNLQGEEWIERKKILGALRGVLAATCIESLEPDLVILDEFQRFRDLMRGEDEAAQLASQLFKYRDPNASGPEADVRVLLLSATPYKMYTLSEETSGEDHYADFVDTVKFLQDDPAKTTSFRDSLERYRRALFRVGLDEGASVRVARDEVASHLRQVMVRTERLAATPDRSGMLREVPVPTALQPSDVTSFLDLQRVARALGYRDTVEFWKSAPYLLNFMEDYELKADFTSAVESSVSSELVDALKNARQLLLDPVDIDAYRRIDPSNARLRALANDTIGRDMWRLLWMPPSLPYYRLGGAFESAGGQLTKRLVFSAWHVVPKVVAGLLTYEAERLMMDVPEQGVAASHSGESRRKKGQRLRFSIAADGRPTGMPVLGMMYPCRTLAERLNPLEALRSMPDSSAVLAQARERCTDLLRAVLPPSHAGEPDQRWYWAAPMLLDTHFHDKETRAWFGQGNLAGHWRGLDREDDEPDVDADADRGWSDHVELARRVMKGNEALGAPPENLADVLALLALAGPAVCALRSLTRIARDPQRISDLAVRNGAGRIAEGLRRLFNQPDVTVMLRKGLPDEEDEEKTVPYWRQALEYSLNGCLQAVLDEYAHVLVEASGLVNRPWVERVNEVSAEMIAALSLRTATVAADVIALDPATGKPQTGEKLRLRSRFAARYGTRQTDDPAQAEREVALRRAFNSPFWPFVLCSTSVGQEGLDFHRYCHAVVHWNLPSNPVDLEQREGRVHRFKGHAVRKNVAQRFASELSINSPTGAFDPWVELFNLAKASRKEDDTDIVPFWVFPLQGGAHIERHVPALPMSRDEAKADQLRRSLTVYRMAFGHSRQEDVVKYLLAKIDSGDERSMAEELSIDLAPRRAEARIPLTIPTDVAVEDFELVEAAPPPQSHGVSLSALEDLLTQFMAMRPKPPSKITVFAVEDLLNAFSVAAAQAKELER
jgi:hypothetical protein